MDLIRKRRLRRLIAEMFAGDRGRFMKATGYSKSRLSQLLRDNYPFGERAAREVAIACGLPEDYFEVLDSRTMMVAARFSEMSESQKAAVERVLDVVAPESPAKT